jgi:PKD repeat protein
MKKITLSCLLLLLFIIKTTAQVSVTPSVTMGCAPLVVTFNNSTAGVTSSNWNFGDGSFSTLYSPTHTYSAPGSYYATCSMNGLSGYIGSYGGYINVKGILDSLNVSTHFGCPGDRIGFYMQTSPGLSVSNITWNFGDGSILLNTSYQGIDHPYALPGVYNVMAYGTSSCGTDTAYQVVTISATNSYFPPFTQFYAVVDTICPGDFTQFQIDNTYENNFVINFDDGQYSTTETKHTYSTIGVYYPSVTYTNHCGFSAVFTDTVYVRSNVPITTAPHINFNDPSCINSAVNFYVYPEIYNSYLWNFGSATINTATASNTYSALGVYPFNLTITNGCGNSLILTDTVNVVNSVPMFPTTVQITDSICPGAGISYSANVNTGSGGGGGGGGGGSDPRLAGITFSWTFGDGSTAYSKEGTHTYLTSGTYNVSVTIANACGNDTTINQTVFVGMSVHPDLSQMFFQTIPSASCVGDTVLFLSGPGGPTGGVMTIDFGDGTNGTFNNYISALSGQYSFVKHAYATAGSFVCHYTFTNNCGFSQSDSLLMIVGGSIPSVGQFFWDQDIYPCEGSPMTFYGMGGTQYTWDFGDGTGTLVTHATFSPVLHTFAHSGSFDVKVKILNGCGSIQTITQTVTVPPSRISIVTNSVSANCGQANGKAIAIASGGGLPYTYQWSNGDNHFLADTITSGIYVITVTDIHGCHNFAIATVNDVEAPTIVVNTVVNVSCFAGNNGAIDINLIGSTSPYLYSWSNGVTTEDVNHLVAGPHEVTVTDANGCSASKSINVTEPAEVVLSMTVDNATCGGLADGAIYVNVSGSSAPYNYIWSTGSNLQQTTGVAAGVYNVTVVDANGCIYAQSAAVSEKNAPLIVIDSITGTGCTNNLSSIYISPIGGMSPYTYAWSNATTAQDLLNVPLGIYTVTVTDNAGCKAVQFREISKDAPAGNPLCMVTVDTASGTNHVIWEKDASVTDINHYNIYKESSLSGLYYLIDQVPYDSLSEYTDLVSDPQIRSWRYKISVVDACGTESTMSDEHKTIHLTINKGLGTTWNLIWDNYEGFPYSTFAIERYTASTGWMPLTTIPSNLNSYTDLTAPNDSTLGYRVDAIATFNCNPTRASINTTRSNIKHIAAPDISGISESGLLNSQMLIFPNPANSYVNIQLPVLTKTTELKMLNVLGQTIYSETINASASKSVKQINTTSFAKGVYTILLETNSARAYKKLIVD